jgi:hypothetical protein
MNLGRRGRPKDTRNLKTDLADELAERIAINEGDRRPRSLKTAHFRASSSRFSEGKESRKIRD